MTNKFFGVFLVLCCLAHLDAVAQKVGFGIKGGLNFASNSGTSNFSFSNNATQNLSSATSGFTGYNIGVYAIIPFKPFLGLQIEANYMQNGYKTTGANVGNIAISIDETRTLNYFQVPVLARLSFGTAGLKVWGNAGVYLGILSNASMKSIVTASGGFTGATSVQTVEQSIMDNTKGFDFGGVVGIGAGYQVGPGHITLDARYNYGFLELSSSAVTLNTLSTNTTISSGTSGQSRVITLSLGYLYSF